MGVRSFTQNYTVIMQLCFRGLLKLYQILSGVVHDWQNAVKGGSQHKRVCLFLIHCLLIAQMHLFQHHLSLTFVLPHPSSPASPFVPPSCHQTLSGSHPPAAHLSLSLSPPSPYCRVFTYSGESAFNHIMHVPAAQHIPSAPAPMHHQRWITSVWLFLRWLLCSWL